MITMTLTYPRNSKKQSAQGMVEFALVLPLLLLIMLGLMELGRMLAFYVAVASAAREGARYGSAAGHPGNYIYYYQDCQGIRDSAQKVGFFAGLEPADITIRYDNGPNQEGYPFGNCPVGGVGPKDIDLGDRVVVTATTSWEPVVNLVPLQPVTLSSVSRRTILKDVIIEGPPPEFVIPEVNFHTSLLGDCVEGECGTKPLHVLLSSPAPPGGVTLEIGTWGSATFGQDYTVAPYNIVYIPYNEMVATIDITVIDDNMFEDSETVYVFMVAAENATIGDIQSASFTIIDDDEIPTVEFLLAYQDVEEGNSSDPENRTVAVQAVLSAAVEPPITAFFSLVSEGTTAQLGTDFEIYATSIVIPSMSLWSSPDDVHIILLRDDLYEEDETIVLEMTGSDKADLGNQLVHTITILNDDAQPEVFFVPAAQSGDESVGEMIVNAQLNAPSGLEVIVPYSVSGTATLGEDFTITPSPVTIPAGEITTPITITVIPDDDNTEGDETVIISMNTPVNATIGTPSQHIATITESPVLPTVWFSQPAQSVVEDNTEVLITAQLSFVSSQTITLPFTVSGSATQGADYTISASPLVIQPGNLTGSIVVNLIDDDIHEGDETIVVTLGTPVNAILGSPSVHTVTIIDNDATPTVSFATSAQTVMEDDGEVPVTVQLNRPSSQNVTVPFTIDPGSTATEGSDYTISPSPVVIPAGSLSADIIVNVIDDSEINEGSETVILVMGEPVNANKGSPSIHTLTIIDNDACPTAGMLQVPIGISSKLSLYISHNSPGARDVTIDEATIYWNNGLGQKLTTIYWGGVKIFDKNMTDSPTLIPSQEPWIPGASREVPAGISLRLFEIQFQKVLGGSKSDYSLHIRFSNTCTINR
jgi:hypothetical protein